LKEHGHHKRVGQADPSAVRRALPSSGNHGLYRWRNGAGHTDFLLEIKVLLVWYAGFTLTSNLENTPHLIDFFDDFDFESYSEYQRNHVHIHFNFDPHTPWRL
jgi:hypothetical protein